MLVTGDMTSAHRTAETWGHCGTSPLRTAKRLGSSAFTEVAMLGDTLLLMDNDTGVFHVWKDPTVEP